MSKAIAIYERVSSVGQDFAAQHGDLEQWAKGQAGSVEWYSDRFTGKSMDRPGLARLLADVRAGKVGKVAVWRLDRLGRTAKGLTALFDELVALKVDFVSLRDGIDLRTPAGRLIANVLASVASYETEIRAERIMSGIQAKRERGEKWNNGRPKGTASKLTAPIVDCIKRLKNQGQSIASIARELRLSRPSIYAALKA
jgi:DNA invertase Pin-like site-specific DNA recombinase